MISIKKSLDIDPPGLEPPKVATKMLKLKFYKVKNVF